MMTHMGIDVSSCQGNNINWERVAAAGKEFVICKSYTGNDVADPTYIRNVIAAKDAGLAVGAYNFLYPLQYDATKINRQPNLQAQLHYTHTGNNVKFVAADLEWPSVSEWAKWSVNANFIKDWTAQYLETYMQLSGIIPYIYIYPYFAQVLNIDNTLAAYPLWAAIYSLGKTTTIAPWDHASVTQVSGSGHCDGISVPVDLDVCDDLSIF
jgi:GH25 family lysozyme M1 (1,4-beta-N-acetylmuramidase)